MIRQILLWRRKQIAFFVALCVVVCSMFCVSGCSERAEGTGRYLAFRDEPLFAEVSGTLNGLRFSAEVSVAKGESSVRYLSPASLEGITVKRNAGGEVVADLNGIGSVAEGSLLADLLLPISLLSEYEGNLEAVQKEGDTTRLALSGGVELILGENGLPVSVESPKTAFAILSWGKNNGENAEK